MFSSSYHARIVTQFQDRESSLKSKDDEVSVLQASATDMADSVQSLKSQYVSLSLSPSTYLLIFCFYFFFFYLWFNFFVYYFCTIFFHSLFNKKDKKFLAFFTNYEVLKIPYFSLLF